MPEFLYDNLYNDKHQIVGVNGVGAHGRQLIHKGIRQHLLCEDCEQHINEYCEKPFRSQWFEKSPLPAVWGPEELHVAQFDYASFKLFHLSVLFRASVSTLPTYQAVSLGPHDDRMREMLLARDPGTPSQYPVFAHVVVHHATRAIVQIVSAPERMTHEGHRCYGMMFGGAYWCYCISSHRNPELETAGLGADGHMPFHAVPWTEVGIVKDVGTVLRAARRSQSRATSSRTKA